MPVESFEKLPFPHAADMAGMFQYYETEKMFRDIELSKKINPNANDFDSWVVRNRKNLLAKLK
jgi:hypothetical protein